MPAPRAVLIDIQNLGLDPKVAHSDLNKSGLLKTGHKYQDAVVKQPVKQAKAPEPSVKEEKVVPQVEEVIEQPVVVEKPQSQPASKKKQQPVKSVAVEQKEKEEIKD